MGILDDLLELQGKTIERKPLTVACECCRQEFSWDDVTWIMGKTRNYPLCAKDLEEFLTKGRGRR